MNSDTEASWLQEGDPLWQPESRRASNGLFPVSYLDADGNQTEPFFVEKHYTIRCLPPSAPPEPPSPPSPPPLTPPCGAGCPLSLRIDAECQPECNIEACEFDSGQCTQLANHEYVAARLFALTGEPEAAVARFAALLNSTLLSDASEEQLALRIQVMRELAALSHGNPLGFGADEVGVLHYDAFDWLIELRLEEVDVLDRTLDFWRNERSTYTLAYAQIGMIDGSLQHVRAQVEASIRDLGGDLGQQIHRAEQQSAGRFDALTDVVQQSSTKLQQSINNVATTQLANQQELRDSLEGLRVQNENLDAKLDSQTNDILSAVREEGEHTRLHSEHQTQRLTAAFEVGFDTLLRGQAALSQQVTESTAATLQAIGVVQQNMEAAKETLLAMGGAVNEIAHEVHGLGTQFSHMSNELDSMQLRIASQVGLETGRTTCAQSFAPLCPASPRFPPLLLLNDHRFAPDLGTGPRAQALG